MLFVLFAVFSDSVFDSVSVFVLIGSDFPGSLLLCLFDFPCLLKSYRLHLSC